MTTLRALLRIINGPEQSAEVHFACSSWVMVAIAIGAFCLAYLGVLE